MKTHGDPTEICFPARGVGFEQAGLRLERLTDLFLVLQLEEDPIWIRDAVDRRFRCISIPIASPARRDRGGVQIRAFLTP